MAWGQTERPDRPAWHLARPVLRRGLSAYEPRPGDHEIVCAAIIEAAAAYDWEDVVSISEVAAKSWKGPSREYPPMSDEWWAKMDEELGR